MCCTFGFLLVMMGLLCCKRQKSSRVQASAPAVAVADPKDSEEVEVPDEKRFCSALDLNTSVRDPIHEDERGGNESAEFESTVAAGPGAAGADVTPNRSGDSLLSGQSSYRGADMDSDPLSEFNCGPRGSARVLYDDHRLAAHQESGAVQMAGLSSSRPQLDSGFASLQDGGRLPSLQSYRPNCDPAGVVGVDAPTSVLSSTPAPDPCNLAPGRAKADDRTAIPRSMSMEFESKLTPSNSVESQKMSTSLSFPQSSSIGRGSFTRLRAEGSFTRQVPWKSQLPPGRSQEARRLPKPAEKDSGIDLDGDVGGPVGSQHQGQVSTIRMGAGMNRAVSREFIFERDEKEPILLADGSKADVPEGIVAGSRTSSLHASHSSEQEVQERLKKRRVEEERLRQEQKHAEEDRLRQEQKRAEEKERVRLECLRAEEERLRQAQKRAEEKERVRQECLRQGVEEDRLRQEQKLAEEKERVRQECLRAEEERLRQEQKRAEEKERVRLEFLRAEEERLRQEQKRAEEKERVRQECLRAEEDRLRQEQKRAEEKERVRQECLRAEEERLRQEQKRAEEKERVRLELLHAEEERLRHEQKLAEDDRLRQEQKRTEEQERVRLECLRAEEERLRQERIQAEDKERIRQERIQAEEKENERIKQEQIQAEEKEKGVRQECLRAVLAQQQQQDHSAQPQPPRPGRAELGGAAQTTGVQGRTEKFPHRTQEDPILFYEKGEPYYEFTNFYQCRVTINEEDWPTTENYFQAQKYIGTPLYPRIRSLLHAREAFTVSRSQPGQVWRRKDWLSVNVDVMRVALWAKFTQNPKLKQLLLETGERQIVEHTARDKFWGDGGDGSSGKNMLGVLLMELRTQLQPRREEELIETAV